MPNDITNDQLASSSKRKASSRPSANVERYQIRLFILLGACTSLMGAICLIVISCPWCSNASSAEAVIGVLAAVVTCVAIRLFAKSISQHNGLPLLVSSCVLVAVMFVMAILSIIFPGYPQARFVIMSCGGCSCALLFSFWFPYVCFEPDDTHVLGFVSCFALLGFGAALILIFVLTSFLLLFEAITLLVSLVSGFCVFGKIAKRKITAAPNDPDRKSRIDTQSTIMLTLNYFQVGICIGTVNSLAEVIVVLAALAIGGLLLYLDQRSECLISERTLSPVSHSLPVIGLLLLCTNVVWLRLIALFLLAGTFAIIFSIGLSAICEHCRICKLNVISVIAKANAFDFAGFGIGLVAGVFIVKFNLFEFPTHYISLIFGSMYCLLASFVGKDRYPDESILVMGVDPKRLEKSSLQQRCSILADRYELSPRQLEVLELLAVGRNARFIAERLTISQSTAQTHIRTIYTKLNVHSHQEVIDKIVNTKLAGEE